MVGVNQGESMYKKWYFEVEVDYIESTHPSSQPHLRIGWATTEFNPAFDTADGFSPMGVGDDVYSYGFDGRDLWFGGRSKCINFDEFDGFRKGDVIGCLLDLSIPEIWFSLNAVPMKGLFREFNLSGTFYPVISVSAKVSCRFLFGDEHGRFKSGPPEGCAPIYQAMLQKQKIKIEPCFSYGDVSKCLFQGPPQPLEQVAFTPNPIDISPIQVPHYIESVRDRLAENLHEIWAMYKIEQGWRFSEVNYLFLSLFWCNSIFF
jgi:ryanodine receptor 2